MGSLRAAVGELAGPAKAHFLGILRSGSVGEPRGNLGQPPGGRGGTQSRAAKANFLPARILRWVGLWGNLGRPPGSRGGTGGCRKGKFLKDSLFGGSVGEPRGNLGQPPGSRGGTQSRAAKAHFLRILRWVGLWGNLGQPPRSRGGTGGCR